MEEDKNTDTEIFHEIATEMLDDLIKASIWFKIKFCIICILEIIYDFISMPYHYIKAKIIIRKNRRYYKWREEN